MPIIRPSAQERETILKNVRAFYDRHESDPYQTLANALDVSRNKAKELWWVFLYSEDGLLPNQVRERGYKENLMVREISRLTNEDRDSIHDRFDAAAEDFIRRNPIRFPSDDLYS